MCTHHIHTCPTLDATVAELSLVMVSYISLKTERPPNAACSNQSFSMQGCGLWIGVRAGTRSRADWSQARQSGGVVDILLILST